MMQRREFKINTLDIDKNKGIGIAVPFNPVNIFTITYTTKEQIKSNLLNFFLTNQGERYFNPNFGANLRALIFNQLVNVEEIRESLVDRVSLYFPSVEIVDLSVVPDYNKNTLYIKLSYKVNTEEDSLSIQIQ